MSSSAPDSARRLRVLVADDSREVRRAITELLAEIRYVEVVAEAENATSALRYATDLRPDAVILDVNMPDHSGIWVLRALQQEGVESDVIILTNHGSEFYRRKSLDAGARYFFDKHVEFGAVADALGTLAEQRGVSVGRAAS